jgi:hypothetical protein
MATASAAVALLCGAAFAYASAIGIPEMARAQHKKGAVTISGHIDNLQPGVPATLTATVRNNLRNPVKVRSLAVKVGDAGPGCPKAMLQVAPVKAKKKLRARRSIAIPISVTLSAAAPEACMSAKFPLKYKAKTKLPKT